LPEKRRIIQINLFEISCCPPPFFLFFFSCIKQNYFLNEKTAIGVKDITKKCLKTGFIPLPKFALGTTLTSTKICKSNVIRINQKFGNFQVCSFSTLNILG